MKKTYIIPSIDIEYIDQENDLLAGSPSVETGDLTGGGVTGPSGSNTETGGVGDESTDKPEDMSKFGGGFFWGNDE